MRCTNCYRNLDGDPDFCPYCGQKQHLTRLTFSHVVHDFVGSILNIDKGYLLTLRMLLEKPGITIRRFISGQRVRYLPPIRFFVLSIFLAIVLSFLTGLYHKPAEVQSTSSLDAIEEALVMGIQKLEGKKEEGLKDWVNGTLRPAHEFYKKHEIYFLIIGIFIVAYSIHLLVGRKRSFTYVETACVWLYASGVTKIIESVTDVASTFSGIGRMLLLGGVVWLFWPKIKRKALRWKRERRYWKITLGALLVLMFLSQGSDLLPTVVGAYFISRVYNLSALRSFMMFLLVYTICVAFFVILATIAGYGVFYYHPWSS
ncbi:hypothetical protein FUAX_35940 [Fulvitalea axinellae]|uniref:DUF3667 domain-containing protein n=1 Tax=Fulvitalea axinellae TaxID=1182444 RepID=A0AAU9CVX3_9BACT|nr:hypothetical protein FUAX_35940 [Fulvitalea axinellae]